MPEMPPAEALALARADQDRALSGKPLAWDAPLRVRPDGSINVYRPLILPPDWPVELVAGRPAPGGHS